MNRRTMTKRPFKSASAKILHIDFSPAVFRKLPKLKVVFLVAEEIDNHSKLKEAQELLGDLTSLLRQTMHKDTIKTHHLISPWQVAREEFGNKAKHYQTSLEQLMEKVLRGEKIFSKETVGNLVKFISLKHLVPLAVDDLEKIKGKITFDVATDKDTNKEKSLHQGDLFYRDDKKMLGAKLDFWKSATTIPSAKTRKVLIHMEVLPPITRGKMREIVQEMAVLLQNFCGAKEISVTLLDQKHRSISG